MSTSNAYEITQSDSELSGALFVALHTDNPGETGANELTGGSYGRQSVTWNASVAGLKTNSNTLTYTGMPAVAAPGIVAYSVWDAASGGNCRHIGWLTNSGEHMKHFTMADTTTDLFVSPAHGYANADMVILDVEMANGLAPAPLVAGTIYFVIASAANTFQLSATSGGAAIALTAVGQGFIQRIVPKIIANPGDECKINPGTISHYRY